MLAYRLEESRVVDGVCSLSQLLRVNAPLAKQELHPTRTQSKCTPTKMGKAFATLRTAVRICWDLNSMISDRRPQEVGRLDLVAGVDEITKMQEE